MNKILIGDNRETLKTLADNSIDSIVTDPPYELGFMGKKWDASGIAYDQRVWAECIRVLKPGGHLLAFSGSRTYHRMTCAIEDVGFEIRDQIMWVYGSGFPKSLDVSKAITAKETTGGSSPKNLRMARQGDDYAPTGQENYRAGRKFSSEIEDDNRPTELTENGGKWQGWGTALKPAHEPICVARKPLIGTVAENVLEHGTGAINIDGCRVGTEERPVMVRTSTVVAATAMSGKSTGATSSGETTTQGRWPTNFIHDGSEEVLAGFPETGSNARKSKANGKSSIWGSGESSPTNSPDDSGSAARFFYCAKASKKDRDEGLDGYSITKQETGLCKEENMELVALLQKATLGLTLRWSIDESGNSIMALSPMVSLSTTLTKISQTIESKTLNWLMPSPINESTVGVSSGMVAGGSHVVNAELSSQSSPNTTSERMGSAHGVKAVAWKMLSSISEKGNWQPYRNIHSTVKPTTLMQYLCRLVTPPGGLVLDPFTGSGSTGKAAILEGFQFIGCELSPEYAAIAEARIDMAELIALVERNKAKQGELL